MCCRVNILQYFCDNFDGLIWVLSQSEGLMINECCCCCLEGLQYLHCSSESARVAIFCKIPPGRKWVPKQNLNFLSSFSGFNGSKFLRKLRRPGWFHADSRVDSIWKKWRFMISSLANPLNQTDLAVQKEWAVKRKRIKKISFLTISNTFFQVRLSFPKIETLAFASQVTRIHSLKVQTF